MTTTTQADPRVAYDAAVADFDIEACISRLAGRWPDGLNACVECCDRHLGENRVALRFVDSAGEASSLTFEDLRDQAARLANVLTSLGIKPGDVVAALLPRVPELVVTILAVWRVGAVYQPLFTAFGPKAIEHRLRTGRTRLVVTNSLQKTKLKEISAVQQVITVGASEPGDIDFASAIAAASDKFEPVPRHADDLLLMMSTSGTTGLPKGVPVPVRSLLAFGAYMRDGIDLRDGDTFWNIADPGWAYGLYYGVIGPLLLGNALTFTEANFSAAGLYDTVKRFGVTSLAGSPTAFRLLVAAGSDAAAEIKGQLRVVSSAGEPLNPETIRWFRLHLDVPVHDHYGQTELGMAVNNHHGLVHEIRMGSAGFSMPGYRMVVLGDDGDELGSNVPGTLAVDIARSPLMWFTGYFEQDTPSLSNGYYRTGDTVETEPDGSITFVGRSDDVITSSGYRIGPFDVESALVEHPAVIESAVIGVPDPERTEIVKAFVVLAPGREGGDQLAEELRLHVRQRLSAHAYPRAIEFVAELPKTPSGKIQRFVLRAAEKSKLEAGR
jgi:acetyl-CoA synthetase